MSPKFKYYLQLFLLMGIPFSVMMAFTDWLFGDQIYFLKYLFLAVFFGGSMSFTLGSIHINRLRKLGVTDDSLYSIGVSREMEFRSELSLERIIEKLKSASKYTLRTDKDEIKLSMPVTMNSWGEHVKIKYLFQQGDQNVYRLSSKPIMRLTLVDFGKNRENLDRILEIIHR